MLFLPRQHGVPSSHGVVDAPECRPVAIGSDPQAVDKCGEHGVGLQFATFAGAHVGGADEEYFGLRATLVEVVDLFTHGGTVGGDGFFTPQVGYGVATELHDNHGYIKLVIGLFEQLLVNGGELRAGTSAHGDVVDSHPGAVVDGDAVEVGVSSGVNVERSGSGIEGPQHAADTLFIGCVGGTLSSLLSREGGLEVAATVVVD